MARQYNKLVRDKIPEFIQSLGETPKFKVLEEEQFKNELLIKLQEEITEFIKDRSLEELADIQEVINALAVSIGSTPKDLEKLRAKKAHARGGFEKRIYLEEVISQSAPQAE